MKIILSTFIFTIMLALAGCQDRPADGEAPTTGAASQTIATATPTRDATAEPPSDPVASRLTTQDCTLYHVSTPLPVALAQRIVPEPFVAGSAFPAITDIIVTHFQCAAILLDNETMAQDVGLSFFGVVVRPPPSYKDGDRITVYDVAAYSDDEALVEHLALLGHAAELATEVSITAEPRPIVKTVLPSGTPYEWAGASAGTESSSFLEPHRRYFMDTNGSLWMDLDVQRNAASIVPLEPGTISWSSGPLATVFDGEAGTVEGFGVQVACHATATFARAPDYP